MSNGQKFDWVSARVKCNTFDLFCELREVVHTDCDRANEHSDERKELSGIKFVNDDPNVFKAVRSEDARTFRFSGDKITVSNKQGDVLLSAIASQRNILCYLESEGDVELPWQFSRRVLEDFFFGRSEET